MNKEFVTKLREAASKAFDAEFRDKLCNAVQIHILNGGKIGWAEGDNCKCPEGCLFYSLNTAVHNHPPPTMISRLFPFNTAQHSYFQKAFDNGYDPRLDSLELNPERALGLLYRERFYNGLPIQE